MSTQPRPDPLEGPEAAAAEARQETERKVPTPAELIALAKRAEGLSDLLLRMATNIDDGGPYRSPALPKIAAEATEIGLAVYGTARAACPEHYGPGLGVFDGHRRGAIRSSALVAFDRGGKDGKLRVELLSATEEDGAVVDKRIIRVLFLPDESPSTEVLLEADHSGKVTFAEGWAPNEASRAFWEALGSTDVIRDAFRRLDV